MKTRLILIAACCFAAYSSVAAGPRVKMSESALLQIIKDGNVTELDQVPALLPKSFLSNFTIKHGLMVDGPRGHLAEADIPGLGQHSTPLAPRAFVFDPYTGFAISYNGDVHQIGGQSLDTLSFNKETKEFRLVKIDFPLSEPGVAKVNSQNCTLCHGPNNRPIFSMYPDWPRFYGSDNDELRLGEFPEKDFVGADAMTLLRRQIQTREFKEFVSFKSDIVGGGHPRYVPLFDPQAYAVHGFNVANADYPEYPYRSDVEQPGKDLNASDVSRAFTRRAGLRFNLLYSRLFVQHVVKKIKMHPRFENYGRFFVYNLMRCAPERGNKPDVMNAWSERVRSALTEVQDTREVQYQVWNPLEAEEAKRLVTTGSFQLPGGQLSLLARSSLLDYGQNLALFGLKINDVDMRFTYHHPAYAPDKAFRDLCPGGGLCSDQVMHVGYLQNHYFNSYNDGSTTMDEHLTANLLLALAEKDKDLAGYLKKRGPFAVRGLLNKYSGETFKDRLVLDREFFTEMDNLSRWFSLPYPLAKGDKENPMSFFNLHHRATFSDNYRQSFDGVCDHLEKKLVKR